MLLDVLMPELDGREVLAHMQHDAALRHIPVVMITALDDVGTAVGCIEAGADDLLPKPFDPVVLRARVKAGLAKKRIHDLEAQHVAETNRLNRRLEARIEEQMAELIRTGELRRFLPGQVADRVLAGDLDRQEASERRKVTVLFADMVGFTDLADSLEPEELAHVLNEYLREMTAIVVSHGGTLETFVGDGLLVIYGAPVAAAEDVHALEAIRTALAMRDRVVVLAAQFRQRGIPADLQIRVGINTGHCTLGIFGSEVLRAYKAVGFTVNIAARLQAAAAPGSIVCGFRTHALVEDLVRSVRREPLALKGASRPVEAWEVLDLVETEPPDAQPLEPAAAR